jgi:hypothetical protein
MDVTLLGMSMRDHARSAVENSPPMILFHREYEHARQ